MKINVNHRVEVKDGGKFVTLLAKKNPHTVSDDVAEILIQEGKASPLVAAKSVVIEQVDDNIDLNAMTVTELRAMAKDMEITGTSEMTKAVLIEAIEKASEAASGENE